MSSHRVLIIFLIIFSLFSVQAAPYTWNKDIPEKKPQGQGNGKLVLFDVSHGGTSGNSDWVLDGGFSDFADDLVKRGYTVREYRGVDKDGDGIIRFYDDRDGSEKNEAVITFEAIKDADVIVFAESNRPFTEEELKALRRYVDSGKGIFFISDHYNADRNLNTWDSTEVFNGYNRCDASKYNMGYPYGDLRNPKDANAGWLAKNFGVRFRFNAIDCKQGVSDIVSPEKAEGLTTGVEPILIAAGGTSSHRQSKDCKGNCFPK